MSTRNKRTVFIIIIILVWIISVVFNVYRHVDSVLYSEKELMYFEHVCISNNALRKFMNKSGVDTNNTDLFYCESISKDVEFEIRVSYNVITDSYTDFEGLSGKQKIDQNHYEWYTLCIYNDNIRIYFDMYNYGNQNLNDVFKNKVDDFIRSVSS